MANCSAVCFSRFFMAAVYSLFVFKLTADSEPMAWLVGSERYSTEGSERLHPMWVLPVAEFMKMTGPPLPHQELKISNLLVEHQESYLTIFVSHQWLGYQHPDVTGHQVQVLRTALENLMKGSVKVEETVVMQFTGIQSKFPRPAELKKAFIWMDWFSIPQVAAASDEAAKRQAAYNAELAIRSIPDCTLQLQMFFWR